MMQENQLQTNFLEVRRRIEASADKVGRNPEEIKLIAVSKTHPVETLKAAIAAGASNFGENKVQEAESKVGVIGRAAVSWHLIGNLQANKARRAVKLFDLIHTVDSLDLANRLERICAEEDRPNLDVLIQVDLAGEATKSGVAEKDLPPLVEFLQTTRHLSLQGLMIIPPFDENIERIRPFFRRLRQIRDALGEKGAFRNSIGELSMGMSGDFETAIEEGATLVRVGTAIFGQRTIS